MKLKKYLNKVHSWVVERTAKSSFVENVLITKTKEGNEWYDCIYCTVIRNALLFGVIGFSLGVISTLVML